MGNELGSQISISINFNNSGNLFLMTKENQKDPLLDELAERILEGPIVFTPDEEFAKRVEEKKKEK